MGSPVKRLCIFGVISLGLRQVVSIPFGRSTFYLGCSRKKTRVVGARIDFVEHSKESNTPFLSIESKTLENSCALIEHMTAWGI